MSAGENRDELDERRERWEQIWAGGSAQLSRRAVPPQVRRASEQQWFPPGAPLLEIGCGGGDVASWLAQNGHLVTAIDYSPTAIDTARRAHAGQPRLHLAVHDMCAGPPSGGPFGAVLDWGCLHSVPPVGREAYLRNLAAVSTEDARLLLFHRAGPNADRAVTVLQELLAPDFELVEAEECTTTWITDEARPGVALRFHRAPG